MTGIDAPVAEAAPLRRTARGGVPRALHVVNGPVAARKQVLPLAVGLAEAGWSVEVASPPGPEAAEVERAGIGYIPLPICRSLASVRHAASIARLARIIRRGRYDIVHLHGPIPGALGRIAAAGTRARVVYHCRGTLYDPEDASPAAVRLSRVYAGVERVLASRTAWALTLNTSDADDLERRAGVPRDRITCLGVGGSGLNLRQWDAARFTPRAVAEIRARLGVKAGAWVVGFVGRIVREKGVLELLDAFAALARTRPDAVLLMVGDALASDRDQRTCVLFRERVVAMELERRVVHTGWLDEPRDAIGVMNLLVLPSYREGFGQVLVEAGALGIPVVATASRGARQAVVEGVTGLLVPPRDPRALADALLRVAGDPALAARLGSAAIARARDELSQERVVRSVLSVYARLLV